MSQNKLNGTAGSTQYNHKRIGTVICLLLVIICISYAYTGFAEALESADDLFYAEDTTWADDWYDEPEAAPASKDKLAALHQYHQQMARHFLEKASELPEDSQIRAVYELYADLLSKPLPGRPSEEESRTYSEAKLSKISSQLEPAAVAHYEECVRAEPQITSDLCDIAEAIGTEMFGLQYRIKSAGDDEEGVCRIADKIAEIISEGGMTGNPLTYEEAVRYITDIVRYTQAGTPDTLTENYLVTKGMLEERGYQLVRLRNSWQTFTEKAPYRGVNTLFVSPDGVTFELQFHTAESLVTKEAEHYNYEIIRNPRTSDEDRLALRAESYSMYAELTEPAHIELIH